MIIAEIVFLLLFGYVFMQLWNWLMPDIFGLTMLNYWQSVGLLVLAKLLFVGFEGRGPGRSNKKSKNRCGPRKQWTSKIDFSKWKHYDKFWEEEGERACQDFLIRNEQENNDIRHT